MLDEDPFVGRGEARPNVSRRLSDKSFTELGALMIELKGYVTYLIGDEKRFTRQLQNLVDTKIAIANFCASNGVTCLSLFDFSNHDRGQLQTIEVLSKTISNSDFDLLDARIHYFNDETQEEFAFEKRVD